MKESEYIIWKCETLDQIKNEHPDWDEETIKKYFSKVEKILERRGFFD